MEFSNSTVKTPEPDTEAPTPTRLQLPPKFTNGVLKRHAPPPHMQMHLHPPLVVSYRECLKNHAASLGGHALDGCGEFMPSPASNPADPTSLRCAACGCHRNFHRRDPEDTASHHGQLLLPAPPQPQTLEYRPHHRHHPPPPPPGGGAAPSPDDSPSPPPISSAYYPPSAPHMLLALSHGHPHPEGGGGAMFNSGHAPLSSSGCRKRFRTKFSQGQKEKMLELAERVGWKMQRKDEELIKGVCGEIGVEKGVFKVWMHNNKNNFGGKKEQFGISIGISTPPPSGAAENGESEEYRQRLEEDSKENVVLHHQILGASSTSRSI